MPPPISLPDTPSPQPPKTKYFGYRTYAFTEGRDLVFASLGDTLNNLVIKTTGGGADVYGKGTAVVSTSDRGVYRDIEAALSHAGFPTSAVNLDTVPAEMINGTQAPRVPVLITRLP